MIKVAPHVYYVANQPACMVTWKSVRLGTLGTPVRTLNLFLVRVLYFTDGQCIFSLFVCFVCFFFEYCQISLHVPIVLLHECLYIGLSRWIVYNYVINVLYSGSSIWWIIYELLLYIFLKKAMQNSLWKLNPLETAHIF